MTGFAIAQVQFDVLADPARQARGNIGSTQCDSPVAEGIGRSAMLIDQDRVAIGISEHEAGGTCGIGFGALIQRDSRGLECRLQVANVSKGFQRVGGLVPARVERQHVALEHPPEKADQMVAIFHDQPVLVDVTPELAEAEFFLESLGGVNILDR